MATKTRSEAVQNGAFNHALAIFAALLVYRTINSYYVHTFFQPDEYFQALEPAWHIAFGPTSGAWITWEWREKLRTAVHPYLFAGAYKASITLCNLLDLSRDYRSIALLWAPRLLQAIFASIMDLATWQTAKKIYGQTNSAAWASLALTVISPWQWFCSVRTFSNSLEATLTAIAVSLFPWKWYLTGEKETRRQTLSASRGMYPALTAAAIAFYLRPTNIIIWMAITAGLVACDRSYAKAWILAQSAIIVGTAVVAAFAGVDRAYYDEWVFPPLRFLYFNIVQSLAVFYGTNRVDYYFTEGLPLLLTTGLPFTVVGVWNSLRSGGRAEFEEGIERQIRFVFALAIIGMVVTLSIIGHKEMRFIYPLLPMLHVLAAKPFAAFFRPLPIPRLKTRQAILALLLAANVYIAAYVSTTHQRGVVDVMNYLRHQQENYFGASVSHLGENRNITVGFLMPCHSTPWRSHLVYPEIQAWALTCEPPVNMSPEVRSTYLDEADMFYNDPLAWLEQNMDQAALEHTKNAGAENSVDSYDISRREWPRYLVFFEPLEPTMKSLPQRDAYRECRRFFNTHWIDDSRRKGDVIVWCRRW